MVPLKKERGIRIAFTIPQKLNDDFNKVMYMQRVDMKTVLTPAIQAFVEEHSEDIEKYNIIFEHKEGGKIE